MLKNILQQFLKHIQLKECLNLKRLNILEKADIMKNLFTALIASFLILGTSLNSEAQQQRSQDFKDKYKLKEAVVLSRHNIRSPLSDSKSALGRMTPHEWNKWTAGKSELMQQWV